MDNPDKGEAQSGSLSAVALPLLIALQFLTRIPLRSVGLVDDAVVGRSLLYYPLVGLLIGALLWLLQGLLDMLLPGLWSVQAAIVLVAWCLLTGGLHLDGLADSADAWIGGFGDRERTLALMKDPTCGPAAVMVLVLVLLVKYGALAALLAVDPVALLLAPLLGRTMLLPLFLTTAYVRDDGLGAVLSNNFNRADARWVLLLAGLIILLGWGVAGAVAAVAALLVLVGLRRMTLVRLGGYTGDIAGALVELTEAAVLVSVLMAL